jgi:hypothetical protein
LRAAATVVGLAVQSQATTCFFGETEDPTFPAATIEQIVEVLDGRSVVHIRITFDPAFVDNTYGDNAVGWGDDAAMDPMDGKKGKSGHTFKDLVGSDHVELVLTDGAGAVALDVSVDYISEDPSSPCGYATLGVTGGEGKVNAGRAEDVLAVATSLDRNLNGCGYCEAADSPATDGEYTPNAETSNWDYRVVYEVWIDISAFGDEGFGQAYITSVHASPSKLDTNTVEVEPTPCPPEWDTPYCPPDVSQEGGNCFGGGDESCPPNEQLYLSSEGANLCTPIPFSGYPGMAPCPEGYELDLASEGRYCLPVD